MRVRTNEQCESGGALSLVNGPVINNAVDAADSNIVKLASSTADNHKVVEDIYYSVLGRAPTENEEKGIDLGTGAKRLEVAGSRLGAFE